MTVTTTVAAKVATSTNGKRHIARVTTDAGRVIGQAIDADESLARKRAIRQAYRWAADYGWTLTFRKGVSA